MLSSLDEPTTEEIIQRLDVLDTRLSGVEDWIEASNENVKTFWAKHWKSIDRKFEEVSFHLNLLTVMNIVLGVLILLRG